MDLPVPQMVEEKVGGQGDSVRPVSERTEQIVHVPGEIPRARVQQRTVELELQSQPGAPRSLMKSGPDAGENPYARVNGLITDLIQTKADSESTLTS